MSSIDQQFVEFIVKSLVGNPDAVSIARTIDEKGVLLELTVDPEDLGRVIGKRGATAQSLRTLLRALGTKNDARYNLKIVDNTPGGRPPRDDSSSSTDDSGSDHQQSQPVYQAPAPTAPADDTAADSDDDSAMVTNTRKELEDLDDLDI